MKRSLKVKLAMVDMVLTHTILILRKNGGESGKRTEN
jgi:hypothetical protein